MRCTDQLTSVFLGNWLIDHAVLLVRCRGQNLSHHTASVHPNITVNGQSHAHVDKFSYLGGIISSGENSVHFLQLMTFTIYPIFVPPGTYHCWVGRGGMVREVLPNTSTDQLTSVFSGNWLINRATIGAVYRSINFSVLGELVN